VPSKNYARKNYPGAAVLFLHTYLKIISMKNDHQEKPGGTSSPDTNDKKKKEAAGKQQQQGPKGLKKEDLPESSNQSTGNMGSGQRQDSN
jgi:hypothetical protein